MKAIIPWLIALAAIGTAAGLYLSNGKLATQLEQLRADNQDLQQFKAAAESNAPSSAVTDELARLRKDNDDLLRLRNETRQLRQENQQLTAQLQSSQAQVQRVQAAGQAQAQALQNVRPVPGVTFMSTNAEAAFRARYGLAPATPEQAALNVCINNLRQIDGAKQQWALEHNKPANTLVSEVNITPYLGNTMPVCPGGGTYTINAIGTAPTCSIPGHQLPK